MLRPRKSRKARNSCGSIDIIVHEDPQSSSGSLDETSDVETLSKPRARTRQSGTGQTRLRLCSLGNVWFGWELESSHKVLTTNYLVVGI